MDALRSAADVDVDVPDVIVIGGGVAGLAAAALIARAGRSVIVAEQSRQLGGRAATQRRDGVQWNAGPHALYRKGAAFELLTELRVPFTGRAPRYGTALAIFGEATPRLPDGPVGLLATNLLSWREKLAFIRFSRVVMRADARVFDRVALRDWIAGEWGRGALASLLHAFFRLATYAADHARLSAGAAIDQLRAALAGNVWYVDDGWQTLVDGLAACATRHGASVRSGAKVDALETPENGRGVVARLAGGGELRARAAVLAIAPDEIVKLAHLPAEAPLARFAARRVPVRAACLDLALSSLPRPRHGFALGIDRPWYFSVHSLTARLAPDGVVVAHAAKYLERAEQDGQDGQEVAPAAVERELEEMLDRLQPGWRERIVARRFLPNMVVAQALPLAEEGGRYGRPAVDMLAARELFLAGDWVGDEGLLADAAAASARRAAQLAIARVSH